MNIKLEEEKKAVGFDADKVLATIAKYVDEHRRKRLSRNLWTLNNGLADGWGFKTNEEALRCQDSVIEDILVDADRMRDYFSDGTQEIIRGAVQEVVTRDVVEKAVIEAAVRLKSSLEDLTGKIISVEEVVDIMAKVRKLAKRD